MTHSNFIIENDILIKCLNKNMTIIEIPDGVTKIYNNAFAYCRELKKIILPDSLQIIDDYAFYFCKKLEYIDIPFNVIEIGRYAFAFCQKLKSIIIPHNVETIGEHAFYCCLELEQIVIPKNLNISKNVFSLYRYDKNKKIYPLNEQKNKKNKENICIVY